MAHCPFEKLADLANILEKIRAWPDIREPKPGIFYYKRLPFLHFHEKDGRRWGSGSARTGYALATEREFVPGGAKISFGNSELTLRYD